VNEVVSDGRRDLDLAGFFGDAFGAGIIDEAQLMGL
jgi:hypothetical protein